jgi:hypothetical protein
MKNLQKEKNKVLTVHKTSCTSKFSVIWYLAIIGQSLGQARVEIVYDRFVWS